ncbi:MFS transporter [Oleiagrimonas soli]|uniref:1-acyl-sn-glycerol-3-phosphate acyltransferase n=1 Tax=Oleiagrimonas soli TaxID=1543381 RepID=A0A099CRY6_9GAMM|nr:MFS transporter [Oleiagrimonas soli]KGI76768.1 glycerol acyltransferase [Oleiagrimonas soli]MBB6184994.1 1-acyl-sn-glycerol-3-phosphate acyltransferase [Oleiagrimonas soli]
MSQFALLGKRRFAPFFLTQALGAFNDNAFRYALIGMATFRLGMSSQALSTYNNIALALFIAPFFLFSASAGQLAERMEKARLIRIVKAMEVAVMALASVAFMLASPGMLLAVLFLMGLQSTLFGPIKYSILPQTLHPSELVGGNGLVETGTSLSILLGSVAGNALMAVPHLGPQLASAAVIGVALAGYLASRAIPPSPATAPDLRFEWNPFVETWRVLGFTTRNRTVFNAILGISWFWFYGATLTVQLPLYTRNYLGGDASVLTLALALFSIGIGVGSLLCERLSGGKVEPGLVPLGAAGMTVFGIDLYFVRPHEALLREQNWWSMLSGAGGWHIAIDLVLIGMVSGFYIVPLFALVQERAERSQLSRIIAGTNIINSLFMVLAAAFGIVLLGVGLSVPQLFLTVAVMNAAVAVYIFTLVPEFPLRFFGWLLVNTLYRIRREGIDRIPEHGPALLVCNHVAFTDPLIVMACVRRPVRFVMYYRIYRLPLLRPLFRMAGAIPIAGAKEDPELLQQAYDAIDAALEAGEVVCLYPEGGLTADGEIAPFKPGISRVLERRPVPVVPMALRGLWGSVFSRRDNFLRRARLPRRFRARIELVVGAPVAPEGVDAAALEARVRELRGAEA